jgi:hypothetical protein
MDARKLVALYISLVLFSATGFLVAFCSKINYGASRKGNERFSGISWDKSIHSGHGW